MSRKNYSLESLPAADQRRRGGATAGRRKAQRGRQQKLKAQERPNFGRSKATRHNQSQDGQTPLFDTEIARRERPASSRRRAKARWRSIKREMRSYLTSAVGYVFLAVFYAIAGYYFFATSLVSNSTDLSYVFSNLFSIVIFLVPMLTMRLFSEERRQKTEQALFTAPVSFTGVVMGKFLACLTMYLLGMGSAAVFSGDVRLSDSDVAVFCGNF